MLLLLPIVLALAAASPSPVPAPAPAAAESPAPANGTGGRPTPLREIGRVRALPACVPIVAHANGAITAALDNDRTLAIVSTNLHNVDYDKLNSLQRKNALDALLRQSETIRLAFKQADSEIKRLRDYAKASPDEQRQRELKAFADALGGALERQKRAAAELARDITIIRGREDAAEAHEIMEQNNPRPINVALQAPIVASPLPAPNPQYNKQMKSIGDDIDLLQTGILVDEGVAADHSIAATSGC